MAAGMKRIEESRFDAVSSEVHDLRLKTVVDRLLESGSRRVVDLGCGGGVLLVRLAWHAEFERIVGIDSDQQALAAARSALEFLPPERQGGGALSSRPSFCPMTATRRRS